MAFTSVTVSQIVFGTYMIGWGRIGIVDMIGIGTCEFKI